MKEIRKFVRISFRFMPLNYERNSPLAVPVYAFGQSVMRLKPHNTSFRPFCTIFKHPRGLWDGLYKLPLFIYT